MTMREEIQASTNFYFDGVDMGRPHKPQGFRSRGERLRFCFRAALMYFCMSREYRIRWKSHRLNPLRWTLAPVLNRLGSRIWGGLEQQAFRLNIKAL